MLPQSEGPVRVIHVRMYTRTCMQALTHVHTHTHLNMVFIILHALLSVVDHLSPGHTDGLQREEGDK